MSKSRTDWWGTLKARFTNRGLSDAQALPMLEALGIDPARVLSGSVELHRLKNGKPSLLKYTTYVTDGLHVIEEVEE